MKNHVLLLAILIAFINFKANAMECSDGGMRVELTVKKVDDTILNDRPRTPIHIPDIYFDEENRSLLFDESFNGCTLVLFSEKEDESAFSTVIVGNTVVLPSSLSGEYKLCIIKGNFVFEGIIVL